ncbi:MAG TPA: GNAT family N-acetyltransferase, partial [Longimicrobiales bacterium]|nr:GNAT family N-acetyltransferase [Longimicrobiales bacterium]
MAYSVERFADPAAFLERAGPWLLSAEAENNLLLGLAERLAHSTAGFEPPVYLAAVHDADGALVGCAFRTPPHKAGLTDMPAAAARVVAADMGEVYDALPAVFGPDRPARAFADAWAAAHGLVARQGMAQRIYRLEQVVPPPGEPAGRMRVAGSEDVDLLARWMAAFVDETAVGLGRELRRRTRDAVRGRALMLWTDGGRPVSMAGVAGVTPNGARVGYVYTPPELRGRGYATWCVTRLSQRMLARGKRFCFL